MRKSVLSGYSLDLFGMGVYPFAEAGRWPTTFFLAPLEGTEIEIACATFL